jgi:hypothetical protein
MTVGTTSSLAIALLLAGACGASEKDVREAKSSGYQTDFAIVYSETLEAVRSLYPELTEDPKAGVIKTAWHPLKIRSESADPSPLSSQNAFASTEKLYFVRFALRIAGGKPWRVEIEGEASSWRMGEVPSPLHGAEVPPWLEGRTDALRVAIYKRLQTHAVPVYANAAPTTVADAGPAELDLSRFQHLPGGAGQVIAEVEKAAQAKDAAGLRLHMADEFEFSVGSGEQSPDTALAVFQADPSLIDELVNVIGKGCAAVKNHKVVCPGEAATGEVAGYRAGFLRQGGAWKLAYFYDAR